MNDAKIFQGATFCPRCGRAFTCGMQTGHGKCWCAELPHRPPPVPDMQGCFCPACLGELAGARADQER